MAKHNKTTDTQGGVLRIIGGSWRSRKLGFPDVTGLRPTGDRVRETVFNWLQPHIGGSRCLDLFAGSGALGFEAASRGAAVVDLVEADRRAGRQLQHNIELLAASQCRLFQLDARQFLQQEHDPYDIVFIDPPYQSDLWSEVAAALVAKALLRDGALIYLEYPRRIELPPLPRQWRLLKEKRAGDVTYCLFEHDSGASE